MRVDTTDHMGRVLAVEGVWEPHVTAVFRERLGRGDVCVDVGANVGYYTLLAAELVGQEGRVYALEPSPETHAALVANVELNGYANVVAQCVAAGGTTGEAVLDSAVQSVRAAIRRPDDEPGGFRVAVRPLSAIVPEAEAPRLRLIKIDVEGYELEVLRGVEPLLEQGARPAVLVELHAGHGQDAAEFLLALGRRYRLTPTEVIDDDGALRLEPWVDHTIHSSGPHILLTP
jgi:FkbM family methyltransferase